MKSKIISAVAMIGIAVFLVVVAVKSDTQATIVMEGSGTPMLLAAAR